MGSSRCVIDDCSESDGVKCIFCIVYFYSIYTHYNSFISRNHCQYVLYIL